MDGRETGTRRIGVVPYLNALPLIEGLEEQPGVELRREVPSRLSEWLARGEIDVASLPIIDAAADESYAVVPGIAIASRGPVRSVCLFHDRPLGEMRRVALDPASRTSSVLLRILLERRHGVRPEYVGPSETGAEEAPVDGRLLIGDAALFEDPAGRGVLDLGEAWTAWTGLPFVYAAWVVRGDPGPLPSLLLEARARGLAAIDRIAREAARRGDRDEERVGSYLREAMRYDLGEDEEEAIRLFFRHAIEIGVLPGGSRVRRLDEG